MVIRLCIPEQGRGPVPRPCSDVVHRIICMILNCKGTTFFQNHQIFILNFTSFDVKFKIEIVFRFKFYASEGLTLTSKIHIT